MVCQVKVVSFKLSSFHILLAVLIQISHGADPDPNVACHWTKNRYNDKDLYADPSDCHFYFQCFFLNETNAIGIRRQCPVHQFFHEEILQCLPEGDTPCYDKCREEATAIAGCYVDPHSTSCSSYFVCSNTISYQMCCPAGTRLNQQKCNCDLDKTCTDPCSLPPAPSTTETPPSFFGNYCRDSYGNILRESPTGNRSFQVVDTRSDNPDVLVYELRCAPGTAFDIRACRCDIFKPRKFPPIGEDKQCLLYLPFDTDFSDNSIQKFATYNYNYSVISRNFYAHGTGSLFVDGDGWVEVPGLKTLALGQAATWCFFYRCSDGADPKAPTLCSRHGGILSDNQNRNGTEFSISVASAPGQTIIAAVNFQFSPTDFNVTINGSSDRDPLLDNEFDFTQVCVVYDGTKIDLYIDGQSVSSTPVAIDGSQVTISHSPLTIGSDLLHGDFHGFIDEVLVCKRALTVDEVDAHFQGQGALFTAGLIPLPPASSTIYEAQQIHQAWIDYKKRHNKTFPNAAAEAAAKAIFARRCVVVLNHNRLYKRGEVSYEMDFYSYLDHCWSTIAKQKFGLKLAPPPPPATTTTKKVITTTKKTTTTTRRTTPTTTTAIVTMPPGEVNLTIACDWRVLGCVNPTVTQGTCGACYTFATAASIEGQFCAKYGALMPQLSLQQQLDCTMSYGNEGCDGGLMTNCYQYFIEKNIIHYNTSLPYKGKTTGKCSIAGISAPMAPIQVVAFVNVPATDAALVLAILKYGPVACAVDATANFLAYKSGVFTDKICSQNAPNHAISVVGYGCTVLNSQGKCVGLSYLIIRNWWGSTWGENGFMRFQRNATRTCAIYMLCSYVTVA